MIDLGNICLRLGLGPPHDQAGGDFIKDRTQNDSCSATWY